MLVQFDWKLEQLHPKISVKRMKPLQQDRRASSTRHDTLKQSFDIHFNTRTSVLWPDYTEHKMIQQNKIQFTRK